MGGRPSNKMSKIGRPIGWTSAGTETKARGRQNSTPDRAWPCGLAREAETLCLCPRSCPRHTVLLLASAHSPFVFVFEGWKILKRPFGQYNFQIKDIYLPRNYYTG
ncbi:hypothetical protein Fot_04355 [Forsythia ovata]|uniref:Uncharacterized protein n=1 Tax=Forsythia ovata TaxID=205694 RepID=A0ABD1XCB7_9LAMI